MALFTTMAKKLKIKAQLPAQDLLLLERVSRLLRSASFEHGLYPAQWEVLRYLAAANVFSNSPKALARYLGATKGTVSQTVGTLVSKGLVVKSARAGDERSVTLVVSEAGHAMLKQDPLQFAVTSIEAMGDKTRRRFSKGLLEILTAETLRVGEPQFGDCTACRYAREREGIYCMKFTTAIETQNVNLLCVEFVASN